MRGFLLLPAAEADLASIWTYSSAGWSVEQADFYVSTVNAAFEALVSGRQKGRPIDSVRPGYRKLSVGAHFIVYRVVEDTIHVVRILHQRMDIAAHLQN